MEDICRVYSRASDLWLGVMRACMGEAYSVERGRKVAHRSAQRRYFPYRGVPMESVPEYIGIRCRNAAHGFGCYAAAGRSAGR